MAYYDALITKWATLSGTTDEKLAAINALTVAGPTKPVPVIDITTYLRTHNLWLQIKAAAAAGSSPGAIAAVDYNSDPRTQTLDVTLAIVQAMLADLVSNSLLSSDQSSAITAMANTTVPWLEANGYTQPIGTADLTLAGGLS